MMYYLKFAIASVIHLVTRVFCIIPIEKNKIVFEAYMGKQYSCSPKAICDYISKHGKNCRLIWVYTNKRHACNYEQIKRNSITYYYHMLSAGCIVINSGKNKLLRFRKKQIVINTWHGGGAYKKITHPGYDEHYRKNDYFISSCEKANRYVINEGQNFHGEILKYGLPRNDMLIHIEPDRVSEIRTRLRISDKHCVLYAPTFRDDHEKTDFALDYTRVIKNLQVKFGGDWVVLHRSHYHMSEHKADAAFGKVIDVTTYPDMQELLLIANALITDYSSSIWDYSFMKRPVFLYATDLKEYDTNRSFFIDIHEWPFQLAENNDELEKCILIYDQQLAEQKISEHHEMMGSYEQGDASRKTFEFIDAHLGIG